MTHGSASALGLTPYQVITAASIVEKEGYIPVNMPDVARVIYNRLAAGMPLQMDSTVLYSLGQDGGPVTRKDLQLQTPYNTYLNTGLTPTPDLHAVAGRAGRGGASAGRGVALLRAGEEERRRWPSPTPTRSSWPTSSWPSHVGSPELAEPARAAHDGRGPAPAAARTPPWSG